MPESAGGGWAFFFFQRFLQIWPDWSSDYSSQPTQRHGCRLSVVCGRDNDVRFVSELDEFISRSDCFQVCSTDHVRRRSYGWSLDDAGCDFSTYDSTPWYRVQCEWPWKKLTDTSPRSLDTLTGTIATVFWLGYLSPLWLYYSVSRMLQPGWFLNCNHVIISVTHYVSFTVDRRQSNQIQVVRTDAQCT